jgi:plasmid maintenance system antidote protein VapI
MKVSERLKLELLQRRAQGVRQYRIARDAGVHPTVVSALINGALPIRDGDERVIRIGAILGFQPKDCFERETAVTTA